MLIRPERCPNDPWQIQIIACLLSCDRIVAMEEVPVPDSCRYKCHTTVSMADSEKMIGMKRLGAGKPPFGGWMNSTTSNSSRQSQLHAGSGIIACLRITKNTNLVLFFSMLRGVIRTIA